MPINLLVNIFRRKLLVDILLVRFHFLRTTRYYTNRALHHASPPPHSLSRLPTKKARSSHANRSRTIGYEDLQNRALRF